MSQEEAMKRRSLVAAATIGVFLLGVGIEAEVAELKVLSAFGMQSVLEDLGPTFERATGHTLAMSFATGGATVKRVQGGEAADVVITLRPGIDALVKDGKAPAGSSRLAKYLKTAASSSATSGPQSSLSINSE
jgi:molybdate transport system substrate-binding protein